MIDYSVSLDDAGRTMYLCMRELYYHKKPIVLKRLCEELTKHTVRVTHEVVIEHKTEGNHRFVFRILNEGMEAYNFWLDEKGTTDLPIKFQEIILEEHQRLERFDKIQDVLDDK